MKLYGRILIAFAAPLVFGISIAKAQTISEEFLIGIENLSDAELESAAILFTAEAETVEGAKKVEPLWSAHNENSCSNVESIPTDKDGFFLEKRRVSFNRGGWSCSVDYEDRIDPEGSPIGCMEYGVICRNDDGTTLDGVRCFTDECGKIKKLG